MKTKLTVLLLFSLLNLLSVSSLKANHLAGGNITYTCLGGNTYQIKVTIFRDCKGTALATPALTVSGCGDTVIVNYTGAAVTPVLLTSPCNAFIKTTCDVPPGTAPGIQRYDYIFTDTLSAALAACTDVTFSYDACCRNAAITTLSNNPGGINMRMEAHLNAVIAPCNNSPAFPNQTNLYSVMFLCLNQMNCFNFGVTEPDPGDSISYFWMTPMQLNGAPVQYNPGFDSAHSTTGTQTLNPITGDICITPTSSGQVAVMAVKVTEWRRIGGVMTKIGWVERDIQLYMISCVNHPPTLTCIDSTNNCTISVCPGSKVCFDIYSNDADVADSVTLMVGGGAPGSFTVSGGKHPSLHYCQQTVLSDSGKTFCFSVTARDNACPQSGSVSGGYCVSVHNFILSPTIYLFNDTIRCTYTSGTMYQWYFNGTPTGGNYSWIPLDSTGTYYVHVTDTNGCSGTSNTFSFTVGMSSFLQNEKSVTIFPNPFSQLAKITLTNVFQLKNVQFTLCDIYGRQVMNEKMEKNELVIDRGNLSEGIYFYSICDNDRMITTGKLLIVE